MNTRQLSFLGIVSAIALSATPVWGETNTPTQNNASQVSFSCDTSSGIPTTILQAENTQKIIFNWQSEYLPQNRTPLSLCNKVADKLNAYSADGATDLSALTFRTDLQAKLPAICATDEPGACNLMLFTLPLPSSPTEEPVTVANRLLDDILDKDLQTVRAVNNKRGLQSVSHSIDIWELILGRKFIKSF